MEAIGKMEKRKHIIRLKNAIKHGDGKPLAPGSKPRYTFYKMKQHIFTREVFTR